MRLHFIGCSEPTDWVEKTMSNVNINMILKHFTVETKQSEINNGKYGFRIKFQQVTSGLYYPLPSKPIIFRYQ